MIMINLLIKFQLSKLAGGGNTTFFRCNIRHVDILMNIRGQTNAGPWANCPPKLARALKFFETKDSKWP